MIKFICISALLVVSCLALPVEEHPKLSRPSPINPNVASDPKPTELKEASPASSTTESHIQKVPASGVKLSIEVAKNEATTTSSSSSSTSTSSTTEQTTKNNPKRSVESDSSASTTKHPAFRRNQPSTSTEQPSSTTASSTTSSPVSVKTPIATTTARTKREVDVTAATASSAGTTLPKRTTTVAPVNANDDKEGPHFVRPVPVDQILKNINQSERTTTSVANEEQPKTVKPKDEKKSEESSEEAAPQKEGSEPKTHQQTHPVIRQQGA
uniref:Uncharacterized protein n=1 Tax=Anopheles epiroticus TaxID=199890 RepID=A0A182PUP9_9DIPT